MDPVWTRLAIVALGGAVGSAGRYGAVIGCARLLGERFAYGVLLVNLVGCLAIGLVMKGSLAGSLPLSEGMRLGIVVGLLGGLTTFSSFGYDTFLYLQQERWITATLNVVGNVVGGLIACWVGVWLAALLVAD